MPSATNTAPKDKQWWGRTEIPVGSQCCWQIGELRLFARHALHEWHFLWVRDGNPMQSEVSFDHEKSEIPDSKDLEQARFVLSDESSELELGIQLADRAMVARPEIPVFIPVGESAALYVSTGIWLQMKVDGKPLLDIPVNRPSDTWFGPNTREGELCYFSLTRARTSNSEINSYPHRSTTSVTVVNDSAEMLRIERLRVPTQFLNLYLNHKQELVTDELIYTLDRKGSDAELKIVPVPVSSDLIRVAESRMEQGDGLVTHTLSRLFG